MHRHRRAPPPQARLPLRVRDRQQTASARTKEVEVRPRACLKRLLRECSPRAARVGSRETVFVSFQFSSVMVTSRNSHLQRLHGMDGVTVNQR